MACEKSRKGKEADACIEGIDKAGSMRERSKGLLALPEEHLLSKNLNKKKRGEEEKDRMVVSP